MAQAESPKISQESQVDLAGIIATLQKTIAEQNATILNLNETIADLRKALFGRRSESQPINKGLPGQLDFISELGLKTEPDADIKTEEAVPETKSITVEGYSRSKPLRKKKSTRDEIFENAAMKRVEIPASDESMVCADCGSRMEHLGWKFEHFSVEIKPAEITVEEIYTETLICRCCEELNDESTVINTFCPPAVIPGSFASPSIISYIMYLKYSLYVPNYRLEKHFLMWGIKLSRATMSNWLVNTAERMFIIIYDAEREELCTRRIINGDETTCRVLHEDGLGPLTDRHGHFIGNKNSNDVKGTDCGSEGRLEKEPSGSATSYMFLFASRYEGLPPIAMFDYNPTRGGYHSTDFIGEGYDGYFICDGFSGYNRLKKARRCGCAAHLRRKFYDALRNKSGPPDETDPATKPFIIINRIFDLERGLKGLPADEIKRRRNDEQAPVWEEFWDALEKIVPRKGSNLDKALTYAHNQKDTFSTYLQDGRIPLTNAYAELQAKSYATGRKNFLFHNTARGARSAAIIMSLIETAKLNEINPEEYLTELITHSQEYINDPAMAKEYLPWSDKMQKTCGLKNGKADRTEPIRRN